MLTSRVRRFSPFILLRISYMLYIVLVADRSWMSQLRTGGEYRVCRLHVV